MGHDEGLSGERAAVLLVTLWMVAILSLLAIGIGFRASIELKLVGYQIASLKAYEIANAGVVKALNEIERDQSAAVDTIAECGISLRPDETLEGKFSHISVGDGWFDVSYTDESGTTVVGLEDIQSKININTADKNVLRELIGATDYVLSDNIRAYRGDADIPQGAASRDYRDKPYPCKGAPFDIVLELLLIKDVTPEVFYGSSEGEGAAGIKDLVTVYGPSPFQVNINTAGQKVLAVLLKSAGLNPAIAEGMVKERAGPDGSVMTKEDNGVFKTVDEVKTYISAFLSSAEGGGLSADDQNRLNSFAAMITCRSEYFRVISTGSLPGNRSSMYKKIVCTVCRKEGGKPEAIQWSEQ